MKNNEKIQRISKVALFSAMMVVCSWISIPLGEIKITLQLLALFLSVSLLPLMDAVAAVTVYLALGAVGLPVFAGFFSGAQVFSGPTAGFVLGFLPSAVFMALLIRFSKIKYKRVLAYILGTLLCYLFGSLWFYFYAEGASLWHIASITVFPYILPDILKMVMAEYITLKVEKHLRKKA